MQEKGGRTFFLCQTSRLLQSFPCKKLKLILTFCFDFFKIVLADLAWKGERKNNSGGANAARIWSTIMGNADDLLLPPSPFPPPGKTSGLSLLALGSMSLYDKVTAININNIDMLVVTI